MIKPELKWLKWSSKVFLFAWAIHQWNLVFKYSIQWWEVSITFIMVLLAIWLIRIYSVSDGMIHTVLKTDFYNQMKDTLISNYKRNKKKPN